MPAIYSEKSLSEYDVQQAIRLLRNSSMFRCCSKESLRGIARTMTKCEFEYGDNIIEEGTRSTHLHVLSKGHAVRYRKINGVEHQIDTRAYGSTINSLHLLNRDPIFASAKCMDNKCITYALSSEMLNQHIMKNPLFSREIIVSLTREVRLMSNHYRTPLFEQHPKPLKQLPIVSVSAGIESYYRSALNSIINARLTGHRAPLFPHMSVQVPTRVLYINGLKGIRQYLDNRFEPRTFSAPILVGLGLSIVPGIIMTPLSSVLEATNAGHYNNEKLYKRWIRGILPRGIREIIFAVGLNQLSDFFEERATFIAPRSDSGALANAIGSINAGIVAGYLSHVPHNLSTYKIMHPHKSYSVLFKEFVNISAPKYLIPQGLTPPFTTIYTSIIACLFPRGCIVRTVQIVGSFMLLNGTINLLQKTQ